MTSTCQSVQRSPEPGAQQPEGMGRAGPRCWGTKVPYLLPDWFKVTHEKKARYIDSLVRFVSTTFFVGCSALSPRYWFKHLACCRLLDSAVRAWTSSGTAPTWPGRLSPPLATPTGSSPPSGISPMANRSGPLQKRPLQIASSSRQLWLDRLVYRSSEHFAIRKPFACLNTRTRIMRPRIW